MSTECYGHGPRCDGGCIYALTPEQEAAAEERRLKAVAEHEARKRVEGSRDPSKVTCERCLGALARKS